MDLTTSHPARRAVLTLALLNAAGRAGRPGAGQGNFIVMASTTSPSSRACSATCCRPSRQASGIDVRVVALGTGQALDTGRRGDADVVFVHDQVAEEKFVADGFGTKRLPVMYNDFVLSAQAADPAKVQGQGHHRRAAEAGHTAGGAFVSRGDKSGTHAAELRYWKAAGTDIAAAKPAGYKECGCGMGPALNIGSSTNAYVLTDRGTWLSSRTAATWPCWSKATSACSTSTA
jgi:tungstate transport system substrate-binding protein